MIREFPFGEVGLISVKDAAKRRKWAVKSVQNWINAGLLEVAVAGGGMRRTYYLRVKDVDAFVPPPRGRPPLKPAAKKRKKGK